MRTKIICRCLLLACALMLASCQKSPTPTNASTAPAEEPVGAVLNEVNTFTDELMRKIETAPDPARGLAEARQFFDGGSDAIREKIVRLRASQKFKESQEAQRMMLESDVDNTSRVAGLKTRFMDRAMTDAAFKSQLDKLVEDYRALFRE